LTTRPRSTRLLLCQGLAGALGQNLGPMDLPANDAEWQSMLRLSSRHLVTPLLRRTFQEHGLVSGLPAGVVEFLDAVYTLNLDCNLRYLDQLAHLIQILNNIGVRPVLLKGAAALVSGLYPTPGERMIGDIDVLVPLSSLSPVLDQLTAVGYQARPLEEGNSFGTEGFQSGGHNYAPLESADWPVAVELHVHPVHLSVAQLLGSEEVVRDATPLNWRGGDCLLPSPTHFVMHNVIHAFVVDMRDCGFLSLRQLFEFVRANRTYGERIDWAVIQQRFVSLGYGSALRGYVVSASIYLGFQVPPELTISGFARLRRRFYRTELGHPAKHFLFSLGWFLRVLGALVRIRAGHLVSNPRRMKKLFRVRFYMRLYQDARDNY
jgi:hypothetical protein